MKISELIKKLTEFHAEHGDLRCVTPGFDETGIDDIQELGIIEVAFVDAEETYPFKHSGRHREVFEWDMDEIEGPITQALLINF